MRLASTPHFTDRLSSPVTSNQTARYGTRELPAGVKAGTGTRQTFADMNSNARLKDGGISSYYRSRERGYSA